jgi:hypothetical protein
MIEGQVLSEDREPLIGATIQVFNTLKGATTNEEGRFALQLAPDEEYIVVSFVGFISDTIRARSNSVLTIQLKEDSEALDAVVVESGTTFIDPFEPIHKEVIVEKELLKAACCNLSESFETNASVDVSFTDAVSGTKMIRMLGLDGRYVQINRENIPLVRGLSSRYGVNFVPGTWLQSIDVGKGSGSVVNGYESMIGQLNLEFKKPENSEKLYLNGYVNSFGRTELNANFRQQLNDRWSTGVMVHGDYLASSIDRNDDQFLDLPRSRQLNVMNRYKYEGDRWISQLGIHAMRDEKAGGQTAFNFGDNLGSSTYGFVNNTTRLELFGKTGLLFPEKPYKGWGFIYSASYLEMDGGFGVNPYEGQQTTLYTNVINQNIIGNSFHQYKTGFSFMADLFDERYIDSTFQRNELVPGGFFEYSYLPSDRFSLVAGIRMDAHNLYGLYVTPRLHTRYQIRDGLTMRVAIGRGYRTPNVIAENTQALISSRMLRVMDALEPEVSWNTGGTLTAELPVGSRKLNLTGEYFYTWFENQMIIDLDQNPSEVNVYNLTGDSYAHSFQLEAQYNLTEALGIKTAYKYYDVRTTLNGQLMQVPMVSRDRYFLNMSYATKYEKWKIDGTMQWYGRKRLPNTNAKPLEFQRDEFSPDFFLVNGQVSRGFRWGNIYLGSENLLDFRQDDPIIDPQNPFGDQFDASMVWGPVAGRMIYMGFRYKLK